MKDRAPIRMETRVEEGAIEILPPDIGGLPSMKAVPLLERAASRLEIIKPKNPFWQGMVENIRGAGAFLKTKRSEIGSTAFRTVAGASFVATMVAACSSELPLPPILEPTPTLAPVTEETEVARPSFESPVGEPNAEVLKTAINTPESFWDGAEIQQITSTEELLNSLKEQGYEPILDSNGNLATIMTKNYARVSLLHLPESLHGGSELIIGQNDGVAFYGPSLGSEERTHVVSSVILSVFSNELFAITALDENNKLVVLLLDNAGTIYGEMRGEYQPNEILKQVWSPIGNQAKLKSQIVFFELYEDILLPEPSKWYEDLSQTDLRNIVQTSERLYDDETIIPLSSVIRESTTQIASPQADFRGIVIDVPKIISLKLTDSEGVEMIRHVYMVPYLLQTRGGEFFIKEVIVGWYQTQRIPTTLANHHELNSGTSQSYRSLPAHTAISSLTPLTQHQLSSTWWMDESLDRSTLAEYPGDLEIFDSILMNKNFASENSRFVQRFASGSGALQLKPGYITIFLITYNVD